MKIGYYKAGIKLQRYLGTHPIESIASEIRVGLKYETQKIRKEKKHERNKLKGELLPYVSPSAIFYHGRRIAANAKELTGLISIDIDDVQPADFQAVTEELKAARPVLLFRSPSGNGIKVLFFSQPLFDEKEPRYYKNYFFAAVEYLRRTCPQAEKYIDTVCNDVTRVTYLCNDPEVYFDDKLESLPIRAIDPWPKPSKGNGVSRNHSNGLPPFGEAKKIIDTFYATECEVDFDDNDMSNAVAVLSRYGEVGYPLAIKLLERMPRHYNPTSKWFHDDGVLELRRKYKNWMKNNENKVGLGSLVKLIQQKTLTDDKKKSLQMTTTI